MPRRKNPSSSYGEINTEEIWVADQELFIDVTIQDKHGTRVVRQARECGMCDGIVTSIDQVQALCTHCPAVICKRHRSAPVCMLCNHVVCARCRHGANQEFCPRHSEQQIRDHLYLRLCEARRYLDYRRDDVRKIKLNTESMSPQGHARYGELVRHGQQLEDQMAEIERYLDGLRERSVDLSRLTESLLARLEDARPPIPRVSFG